MTADGSNREPLAPPPSSTTSGGSAPASPQPQLLQPTPTVWSSINPQFTLYSHETGPNGYKVLMLLNELQLTYRVILLDFGSGPSGMKTPYFESINPNGRIPALIDHSVPGIEDGNGSGVPVGSCPAYDDTGADEDVEEVAGEMEGLANGEVVEGGTRGTRRRRRGGLVIWESGAIMTYLARKYDREFKLWGRTVEEQSQIETWLFYQVSGQAPYLGQAMWFTYYHHEPLPSAASRYISETRRVLSVVERQLTRPNSNGWLVLGRMTLADIAYLHFYLHCKRIGIVITREYPAVWAWMNRMRRRESFVSGKIPVAGGGMLRMY